MKKQIVAENAENWSNLSPELDAAVDRAHAQVAAGKHSPGEEVFARVRAITIAVAEARKSFKNEAL